MADSKLISTPMEGNLTSCCKVDYLVLYDRTIPLQGIFPRHLTELAHLYQETSTRMVAAKMFTRAQNWKQSNVQEQKNGLIKGSIFRQCWKQINHNLSWKDNCSRGHFPKMASYNSTSGLKCPPRTFSTLSNPSHEEVESGFPPFEFGWVFVTAFVTWGQKLCDFWGLAIKTV